MTFGNIYLTPRDPDSYSVGATITNAIRVDGQIRLVFQGRDPENGDTYEGTLQLEHRTGEQSVAADYINNPRSTSEERRTFTLVGSFIDDSCTYFDGAWVEQEFTLDCVIEDIAVR